MDEGFIFRVEPGVDGLVVRLHGDLDLMVIGPLSDALLLGPHDAVVTIDFSDLTSMDSTGINLLVKLQHRVREQSGKLVLYGMRRGPLSALQATGLLDYFDSIVPE